MSALTCDDFLSNCCGSCHVDEEEGYDNLWWFEWLHICCAVIIELEKAGVDLFNETDVRDYVAKSNTR